MAGESQLGRCRSRTMFLKGWGALRNEIVKWEKVVKASGARAE